MSEMEMATPIKEKDSDTNIIYKLMETNAKQGADIMKISENLMKAEVQVAELTNQMKEQVSNLKSTLFIVVATMVAVVCLAGLVIYTNMSQSKELTDHATAINNNSYSIESIVKTISGGK